MPATVLVVDDEESVCRFLRACLEPCGYHVLTATSGTAALGILQERRGGVDLLITDVRMPEMDGIQLAARSVGLWPHLNVLFISGEDQSHRVPDRYLFLMKPIHPDALRALVGAVMDLT